MEFAEQSSCASAGGSASCGWRLADGCSAAFGRMLDAYAVYCGRAAPSRVVPLCEFLGGLGSGSEVGVVGCGGACGQRTDRFVGVGVGVAQSLGGDSGVGGRGSVDVVGESCDGVVSGLDAAAVYGGCVAALGGDESTVVDVVERSGDGGGATSSGVVVNVRGKHYEKNRRKRAAKKCQRRVPEWRRGARPLVANEFVSAFDGCEKKVKDELRDSRARMLVEKNKLAAVKAVAEAKKLDARVQARVDELQLEEYRHKLDAERKKRIEVELSKLPAGYAETMVSEGISSPIPSLSDGSVSPNSSVSVAQVSRMEDCIQKLTARVAELTAESVERDVKQKAAAMMKASSRVQVRYNDGYSVWD